MVGINDRKGTLQFAGYLKGGLTYIMLACTNALAYFAGTENLFFNSSSLRHNKLECLSQQWKGINHKLSTRWQHLSRFKASAFFSLQFILAVMKDSNLYLGLVLPSGG
jgi:hypothetical protein